MGLFRMYGALNITYTACYHLVLAVKANTGVVNGNGNQQKLPVQYMRVNKNKTQEFFIHKHK
jgi:hypothetical protein